MLDDAKREKLRRGCVIPAHPLALDAQGGLDERRQRALTRYYLAAGAGGLAVGVHTTQFAIHDPGVGLYRPVLELAKETADSFAVSEGLDAPLMIAGVLGKTKQAVREAELAVGLGYDIGLLSLTALTGASVGELIGHCKRVAEVIPVMGFYLQSTISGMVLPGAFWGGFSLISNVVGIKIAPFHRYQTLDVLEGVARSGRAEEIALYTGNDDNIIVDLLTRHAFCLHGGEVSVQIVGGLLGQWACWTRRAVEHLEAVRVIREGGKAVPGEILTLGSQLTLANKAIFDAENQFAGCIPGIAYVLKRQGLLANVDTLEAEERMSAGQAERIDEISACYPHLTDDEFVAAHREAWLRG
jgi:dihydrodipicolinate synthase/N-acetylneuraminate lyase